jgi:hypothetical protein
MARRLVVLVGFVVAAALSSLQGQQPTPQAPATQPPAAQPPVTQPPTQAEGMFRQYAPGLLARVNYQADAPGQYRVALWDLLVGPGKTADAVKLPGAAVVEVRSGSGRAVIDSKARDITGGATFAVDEGSSLALANGSSELALALRVTLISARTP